MQLDDAQLARSSSPMSSVTLPDVMGLGFALFAEPALLTPLAPSFAPSSLHPLEPPSSLTHECAVPFCQRPPHSSLRPCGCNLVRDSVYTSLPFDQLSYIDSMKCRDCLSVLLKCALRVPGVLACPSFQCLACGACATHMSPTGLSFSSLAPSPTRTATVSSNREPVKRKLKPNLPLGKTNPPGIHSEALESGLLSADLPVSSEFYSTRCSPAEAHRDSSQDILQTTLSSPPVPHAEPCSPLTPLTPIFRHEHEPGVDPDIPDCSRQSDSVAFLAIAPQVHIGPAVFQSVPPSASWTPAYEPLPPPNPLGLPLSPFTRSPRRDSGFTIGSLGHLKGHDRETLSRSHLANEPPICVPAYEALPPAYGPPLLPMTPFPLHNFERYFDPRLITSDVRP
jgi:hypothetical protein